MQGVYIVFAAICVLAGCSGPTDQSAAPASPPTPALDAGEVNLDVWLERLEVGSRELYSARDAVVAAARISEGDVVADIGAGTGLYTLLFAEAVGPTGLVFAEDIEPLFLDLINRRVDDLGYDNVTSVLGRDNNISLPKESVDIVFIADTYHYFSDREEIMRSVYAALKPGGALIVIDYKIAPGERRPEHKSHVRFGKAGVISEMEFIGFEITDEISVEGLDDNYFLRLKP